MSKPVYRISFDAMPKLLWFHCVKGNGWDDVFMNPVNGKYLAYKGDVRVPSQELEDLANCHKPIKLSA